ncbi:class E sortase [Corynebacterium canis]|uniref:Class E sortase n=1 Tax=Corynebacterium canis TaxID=679663 RepID=A0A5C5UA04_9CORY|nr:class E sortase [Corynebacterium canis]TWT22746.1 class E sortase [Corynebacterium canis]WJY76465.1 Sortase family protein [Corynebacterium canis]
MSHAAAPRRLSLTQVLGELFITVGVLFFLFAFYESYWTNLEASREQSKVSDKLDQQWQHVNPRQKLTPELGEAFARMYIPAFGSDFHFAIVEGTTDADLLAGPGRYTESQLPGDPGNFAVAGHRVGKGAPFNDLGNLKVCDAVVVETSNRWDVYRILPIDAQGEQRRAEALQCLTPEQAERLATGDYAGVNGRAITVPGDIASINPIPGLDVAEATPEMEALMTMTTCHPQFSNAERMIVHAMLVRSEPKQPGVRPAELEEK